ncbi:MAG: hypothetical protein R3E68_07530 [Burkholderiaceae bacterium]
MAGRAAADDEADVQRIFPYHGQVPAAQRVALADLAEGELPLALPASLQAAEILVIGSLDADSDNVLQVPGPILVAYTIAERMGQAGYPLPLNRPVATVLITGLTGMTALGVFVAGFARCAGRCLWPGGRAGRSGWPCWAWLPPAWPGRWSSRYCSVPTGSRRLRCRLPVPR